MLRVLNPCIFRYPPTGYLRFATIEPVAPRDLGGRGERVGKMPTPQEKDIKYKFGLFHQKWGILLLASLDFGLTLSTVGYRAGKSWITGI